MFPFRWFVHSWGHSWTPALISHIVNSIKDNQWQISALNCRRVAEISKGRHGIALPTLHSPQLIQRLLTALDYFRHSSNSLEFSSQSLSAATKPMGWPYQDIWEIAISHQATFLNGSPQHLIFDTLCFCINYTPYFQTSQTVHRRAYSIVFLAARNATDLIVFLRWRMKVFPNWKLSHQRKVANLSQSVTFGRSFF